MRSSLGAVAFDVVPQAIHKAMQITTFIGGIRKHTHENI